MKGEYETRIICTNCGKGRWSGFTIRIPIGRPISMHPCPKCGVAALRKHT